MLHKFMNLLIACCLQQVPQEPHNAPITTFHSTITSPRGRKEESVSSHIYDGKTEFFLYSNKLHDIVLWYFTDF